VFLKVLEQLNQMDSVNTKIEAGDCLVIEDSVSGVEAARLAGMKCLAVTNSYDRDKLSKADLITDSLKTLLIRQIEELFY